VDGGSVFEALVRASLPELLDVGSVLVEVDSRHQVQHTADVDDLGDLWSEPGVREPDPARAELWGDPGWRPPVSGPEWELPGERAAAERARQLSPAVELARQAVAVLLETPAAGRPVDTAALFALAEQLRGLALRDLAEMNATGSHLAAGAVTAATWLRDTRQITDVAARAEVRLAECLRTELPGVGRLLQHGQTTLEHARAAQAGVRGLDTRLVQDSDPAICALLTSTDPGTVRTELRERAEALNPELGRDAERRAHARRGFTVDEFGNGSVLGGALGVEDTQVLLLGLDSAIRHDRHDGDTRSLRQRRADTLLSWARQATPTNDHSDTRDGQLNEDLRTSRTQLLLTCTAEQLAQAAALAHLGGRQQAAPDSTRMPAGGSFGPQALISLDALRRLVCDASISLLVHPSLPTGTEPTAAPDNPLGLRPAMRRDEPLYVGRAARIVTAAQWRALVVRDRHCVIKGCRRPPIHCEAHHVRHWLDGGTTDLDNLVLLCFQHHHDHHDRGHDLQHHDGRWVTSTGWGAHAPP
jgi:hypothetical protein